MKELNNITLSFDNLKTIIEQQLSLKLKQKIKILEIKLNQDNVYIEYTFKEETERKNNFETEPVKIEDLLKTAINDYEFSVSPYVRF